MTSKVLLKYYTNDDNTKFVLENRKDQKGIHTHTFTSITSLRNYLRTELKIQRGELNEIVDLLLEGGIVFNNNPYLKHYVNNGKKLAPSINLVTKNKIIEKPKSTKYFSNNHKIGGSSKSSKSSKSNKSTISNKSVNSKYVQNLEKQIKAMEKNNKASISSISLRKGTNTEAIEETYVKKMKDMEERYVRKMEAMEERFNKKINYIEDKYKKREQLYQKYIDSKIELDYKQNDKFLEYLNFIEDPNLLWFLIILPQRRFRNEKEEEKFYKKCCNRFEKLLRK